MIHAHGLIISPFALWISVYSYSFYDRVSICALKLKTRDTCPPVEEVFGNTDVTDKLKALLSARPAKIIVIAGTNEVGKSTVLRSVLADRPIFVQSRLALFFQ